MKISYKKLIILIVSIIGLLFLFYLIYQKIKTPDDIKYIEENKDSVSLKIPDTINLSDTSEDVDAEEDKIENKEEESEVKSEDPPKKESLLEKIIPGSKDKESDDQLPIKIKNNAPFIPQAPYKIWDDLHDEACEEAAIITAYFFVKGKDNVSIEIAEQEIQNLVKKENSLFGGRVDINALEMKQLAREHYQIELELVEDDDLEKIKKYLADNRVIIIPVAGRLLGNPYFRNPGPLYHALVIIGYDERKKEFIVQEPGTKRGEGFRYSYDTILNAIHDYPGDKEKILEGQKVILVSEQPK